MMEYYPSLVEAAIEFRVYHRKLIALNNGERYDVTPEHQTCVHSKKFRLIKDQSTNYIYCCKLDQTLDERKDEKRDQLQKPQIGNSKPQKKADVDFESPRGRDQKKSQSQDNDKKKSSTGNKQ